ncbi:hypothetical protein DRW41_05605 [Neobacillus piezotolerans]|uniref:Uncharacterized protein n=1 Tax=Neobacillus piezotolerans TaxID=2259171 RepID=A0A3D8GS91_9BACI|nr:hypothetical protein [Neobacillus piezotolerans]RDU37325.1 hypothetical protein DRW41_05605 [Neobacillus piezotolerans]
MFTEMNNKLVAIKGELRKDHKYRVQMADYEQELAQIEERIAQLQNQFESEQDDVVKLERLSLANLLATLAGTKETKLTKEKQEMLAAQHKLSEARKTKGDIDKEISLLHEKMKKLEASKLEYQQLLKQKEELIKESPSPFAEKLFELIEQEGGLQSSLTELNEAIAAGGSVKNALMDALESLDRAGAWGQFDMFGGGTISGIKKHQHIDAAEESLHRAQVRMRKFQKELLDVKETAYLDINVSGMLKFADFFFDGFIVDYMVQSKITQSVEETRHQNRKVSEILTKLEKKQAETLKQLEAVQKEKREIVENL